MKNVQDFILENMSGRMADQLREDVADAGVVKPSDAEDAMSAFVAVIREMEVDGNLQLIVEEDEEA
jgi:flagellar motor switch protein FliG